jgi:hypothetical protein
MRSGIGSLIATSILEAFFLDRGDGMVESPDPT